MKHCNRFVFNCEYSNKNTEDSFAVLNLVVCDMPKCFILSVICFIFRTFSANRFCEPVDNPVESVNNLLNIQSFSTLLTGIF